MQKKKIQIFLGISGLALCTLVLIQIRWVSQARQLNESQFRHRVSMALHETVNEYTKDKMGCNKMRECMQLAAVDSLDRMTMEPEIKKLDSILKIQFKDYQVSLPYSMEVLPCNKHLDPGKECYYFSLRKAIRKDEAVLNVFFQDKEHYLLDRMGVMFISSIVLIVILSTFFGMTVFSLFREKRILGRTTDLINNITHEFKTPMATISLASGMLKRDRIVNKPERIQYYADMIQSENGRLRKQVDSLLKLTCMERGELKMRFEEVDVHALILDLVNGFQIQVEEKQGCVMLSLDAESFKVWGDRELLQNVFANLLDNAIKYSRNQPQIHLFTQIENQFIKVKVSDKGIGMSREEQKHIFDRYYRVQTGDVHDVKGFGIGLSYAKMIIDAHNGKIGVNSKKGMGSTFTIFIPLKNELQA